MILRNLGAVNDSVQTIQYDEMGNVISTSYGSSVDTNIVNPVPSYSATFTEAMPATAAAVATVETAVVDAGHAVVDAAAGAVNLVGNVSKGLIAVALIAALVVFLPEIKAAQGFIHGGKRGN